MKGDEDDAPVEARDWYQAMLDEPDPTRKVELIAHSSCQVKLRIGPMLKVIRSADEGDPDGAALWHLIQTDFHANQRALVDSIDAGNGLRDGFDAQKATDILWALNRPGVWLLRTGERGWSAQHFESWFATSCASN